MTVYVDNANLAFGRMIMCHVIADSDTELLSAIEKINLDKKYHQYPNTWKSHFDVCKSKKKLLIENGAVEISYKELGKIILNKRSL